MNLLHFGNKVHLEYLEQVSVRDVTKHVHVLLDSERDCLSKGTFNIHITLDFFTIM